MSGMSSGRSRSGGSVDLDDGEPEVEVGAEAARVHLGAQVAVGGGDEAHVHRSVARWSPRAGPPGPPARAAAWAGARRAARQSRRGRPCRRRPPRRRPSAARGAGEGALLVAEQLALEEVRGDRAAVDDQEGLVRRARSGGWTLGRLALAGAGLALQQHRDVAGRGALQQREGGRASATELPTSEPKRVLSERPGAGCFVGAEARSAARAAQARAGCRSRSTASCHLRRRRDGAVAAAEVLHPRAPSGPTRTSQWKRETVGSPISIWFNGCEPSWRRSEGTIEESSRQLAVHPRSRKLCTARGTMVRPPSPASASVPSESSAVFFTTAGPDPQRQSEARPGEGAGP